MSTESRALCRRSHGRFAERVDVLCRSTWEPEAVLSRSAPRILSAYVNQPTGGANHLPEPVRPSAATVSCCLRLQADQSLLAGTQMDTETPAATSGAKPASPKGSPLASATEESAGANAKPRKTAAQTKALNEAFAKSDALSPGVCAELVASTGLAEKEVKEFFARKRKREQNKSDGDAETKKRKGKDDGKGGPAKKKKAAASAAAKSPKKSPKAKPVKATAAQTEAAIKAIEAIHGPPRLPIASQGTPEGKPEEVAALKAEVEQLKQELAEAKSAAAVKSTD